jgi:tRNA(fMet)-specific endonuclease VapC
VSFLLDTNTCIAYLNGRAEGVRQSLAEQDPRDVFVCSVVKAELYFGAMKSSRPVRTLEEQRAFLDQFVSISFDDRAAIEYGRIRATLKRLGTPIGPNDMMIAAIAIANDLTLVTHNTSEFSRVDGLALVDWQAEK